MRVARQDCLGEKLPVRYHALGVDDSLPGDVSRMEGFPFSCLPWAFSLFVYTRVCTGCSREISQTRPDLSRALRYTYMYIYILAHMQVVTAKHTPEQDVRTLP